MAKRNLQPATFQRDVATHELVVLRDDGVYRHLRFRRPGTMCMHFDILTWPGYLCYTGDMGTYVFQRLEDMLMFFRRPSSDRDLFDCIDMRYWAEKVQADDRNDGITEFDPEAFRDVVKDRFDDFIESRGEDWSAERREALWSEVVSSIFGALNEDDPHRAFWAVHEFNHDGLRFEDFFEFNTDAYTHRFQWCCFALRWGIAQYDAAKVAEPAHEGG